MIEIEDHGRVRVLKLARPPVNALNRELITRLESAVTAAPKDGARGIVLTGAGGRFCAGLDVQEILSLDGPGLEDFLRGFFSCLKCLANSSIPIAAAINGHCPAAGAVLALYCDRRVMAEGDYRIGLNEVQVGLFPGAMIHAVLARTVGARVAADLLPAGSLLDAHAALEVGFVHELVPLAQVERAARAWLERMLALPPTVYAQTRALVRADLVAIMAAIGAAEVVAGAAEWRSPESLATLRAVLAKLSRR